MKLQSILTFAKKWFGPDSKKAEQVQAVAKVQTSIARLPFRKMRAKARRALARMGDVRLRPWTAKQFPQYLKGRARKRTRAERKALWRAMVTHAKRDAGRRLSTDELVVLRGQFLLRASAPVAA